MQTTLITLVIILLCLNIALVIFLIRNKKPENKEFEIQKILNELKENFSTQVTGITSSFNSLSKDVTRDTTQTLTKVDSQVSNLNQQIELLNKGQKDFTKILSGVKKYGVLAEYTLEAIIKDLLPANQYIANAKMRPEEDNTKVEGANVAQTKAEFLRSLDHQNANEGSVLLIKHPTKRIKLVLTETTSAYSYILGGFNINIMEFCLWHT